MRNIKVIFIIFCLLLTQGLVHAQTPSDYLILQDIGGYKFITQRVNPITDAVIQLPGYIITNNSGVLMGSGHFLLDHNDKSYKTYYESKIVHLGIDVEVTQHTGGDSDRWLLHEIEISYRSIKMERMGMMTEGTVMRKINSQRVLWIGLGGGSFTWTSNNVVIKISYTDLDGTKPEPLEIVQAYLTKFPSTITTTDTEFKSNAYNIKWIKDEIDRRLWLCDKWNAQFQAGKTTQKELLYNLVSDMEVFLNYREKYFSDIKAIDEISALYAMQTNKDATSIQKKLTEYKTWWSANKGKSITLQ